MTGDETAPDAERVDPDGPRARKRLRRILELIGPGQLVFFEVGPPRTRATLVDEWRRVTGRRVVYVHLAHAIGLPVTLPLDSDGPWMPPPLPGRPIPDIAHAQLSAHGPADVCVLDGFEHWARTRDECLALADHLNLSRERLSGLPAAVILLMPAYLIHHLRQHAINLWSVRSFHEVLFRPEYSTTPDNQLVSPPSEVHATTERVRLLSHSYESARGQLSFEDMLDAVGFAYLNALIDAGDGPRAVAVAESLAQDPRLDELPLQRAKVTYWRGMSARVAGELDASAHHLERALAGLRALDEPRLALEALGQLGTTFLRAGRYERAEACLENVLEQLEQEGLEPSDGRVFARLELATAAMASGRWYRAYGLLESAYAHIQSRGSERTWVRVEAIEKLAFLLQSLGDFYRAAAMYRQLLDTISEYYSESARFRALHQSNIGELCRDIGDRDRALLWFERARASLQEASRVGEAATKDLLLRGINHELAALAVSSGEQN